MLVVSVKLLERWNILLGDFVVEQPSDDGEVAALIVGWEDDRVLVSCCGYWSHAEQVE